MHQRRLARARRPHDRGEAGRCNVEVHAGERVDGGVARPVGLHQVTGTDHRLRMQPRGGRSGRKSFLGDGHDGSCPEGGWGHDRRYGDVARDPMEQPGVSPVGTTPRRSWGRPDEWPERVRGRSASGVAHGHVAVLRRELDGAPHGGIGAHVGARRPVIGRQVDAIGLARTGDHDGDVAVRRPMPAPAWARSRSRAGSSRAGCSRARTGCAVAKRRSTRDPW